MAKTERARFPVVVHAMLLRDGRIFMLRRARTGFMDGYYALPGGHVDEGESVRQALIREVREETGVEVTDPQPRCVLPYISGRHQGINFVFDCPVFRGEPYIAEPDLFDECHWADPAAIAQPAPEWIEDALDLDGSANWYRELRWD
jgi:8-oxo-dGTP pyrophosphatase MutT (NUDIX family)